MPRPNKFPPPTNYADLYAIIGGSTTQVFHTGRAQYVAVSDSLYIAWLAANGVYAVFNVPDEATLWSFLADFYPAGVPAGDATAQDALKQRQIDEVNTVLFKIAFNHENRIRALKGDPAINQLQFIAAIKALL